MSIRNKAFAALALTSLLGVAACGSTKDEHGEGAPRRRRRATTEGAAAGGARSRRA